VEVSASVIASSNHFLLFHSVGSCSAAAARPTVGQSVSSRTEKGKEKREKETKNHKITK